MLRCDSCVHALSPSRGKFRMTLPETLSALRDWQKEPKTSAGRSDRLLFAR